MHEDAQARLYDLNSRKKKKRKKFRECENRNWVGTPNYVLHPYRLVKDNRTNFESTDPDKVLDGNIDAFLESSLYK